MKKSLDYIKCVLRLSCVVHEPIYGPFMGCTVNGFLYLYKVYQGWELQQNGPTDLPKENGPKFAPTALVASKFLLGNTIVLLSIRDISSNPHLHRERINGRQSLQTFPSEASNRTLVTPRYPNG